MNVAIDKRRRQHSARRVHRPFHLNLAQVVGLADVGDAVAVNNDAAIGNHPSLVVDGDDVPRPGDLQ